MSGFDPVSWLERMFGEYPGAHPGLHAPDDEKDEFIRRLLAWAKSEDPAGHDAYVTTMLGDHIALVAELELNDLVLAGKVECVPERDGSFVYRRIA